jgi:hypothetical protein
MSGSRPFGPSFEASTSEDLRPQVTRIVAKIICDKAKRDAGRCHLIHLRCGSEYAR